MNNHLRQQVLRSFKNLHKARKQVFFGDNFALELARRKINDEYKSKITVSDQAAIQEMIKYANDVEVQLRTTVVQIEEIQPGKYKMNITGDTVKLDNTPYKECSK